MKTNIVMCYLYRLYAFFAFMIPLALLFAFNYNVYIATTSAKISFFGYLIIILTIIAFKDKLLKFMKDNYLLSISITGFIISMIMRSLAEQMLLIFAVAIVSSFLSGFFDKVAAAYYSYAFTVNSQGAKTATSNATLSQKNAWRLAYGFPIK